MSTEEEINPYELLELTVEATEAEIKSAYRKRSLKVHPDRNPNNPDAARKFHELNQAYELLLDPLRRLALDAKIRLKEARKQRYAHYDNKRKTMVDELETREREFKKSRLDKQKAEAAQKTENERIKEEGRKLREKRAEELEQQEADQRRKRNAPPDDVDEPPALDPLDTTVKLRYKISSHPELTTPDALSTLLSPFGPTDTSSIVLSMKPPKKDPTKPAKFATALVPFKQIGDAFGAVGATGQATRGLDGIEIGWARGQEPPILDWLRKMGKLGSPKSPNDQPKTTPEVPSTKQDPASSFPTTAPVLPNIQVAGMDYESLTLLRLRQAERERLEQEILAQEAAE